MLRESIDADRWPYQYYTYYTKALEWQSLLKPLPKSKACARPCYDNGELRGRAFEENSFILRDNCSDYWMDYDAYPNDILARYGYRHCAKCGKKCSLKEIMVFLAKLTGKKIMHDEERFAFAKVRKIKKLAGSMLCAYYLSSTICPECVPLQREFMWKCDYHRISPFFWQYRKFFFKDFAKIPPLILWMHRYTESIWVCLPIDIIQIISQYVLFSRSKEYMRICVS